jgi:hypothetical protein
MIVNTSGKVALMAKRGSGLPEGVVGTFAVTLGTRAYVVAPAAITVDAVAIAVAHRARAGAAALVADDPRPDFPVILVNLARRVGLFVGHAFLLMILSGP